MIANMEGDVVWGVMKYSGIRWCWRLHNFVTRNHRIVHFQIFRKQTKKKKIHQNGILVERHRFVLKVMYRPDQEW